jgi:hypothetical protein
MPVFRNKFINAFGKRRCIATFQPSLRDPAQIEALSSIDPFFGAY